MSLTSLLCWSAFLSVLFLVSPDATNWIGFSLFYSSLFLAVVGTTAIIGFLIRFVLLRQELVWHLAKEAFRQSFLFALLVIICLYLLSQDLFTFLNLIFLIISLSILEFFMLSLKKRNN
ncbi:MAG: hypothetical protein U9Q85_01500 [Patescibacteria group bacterium]|nr:hypothetical protein [Patescibacteria group bacterium]